MLRRNESICLVTDSIFGISTTRAWRGSAPTRPACFGPWQIRAAPRSADASCASAVGIQCCVTDSHNCTSAILPGCLLASAGAASLATRGAPFSLRLLSPPEVVSRLPKQREDVLRDRIRLGENRRAGLLQDLRAGQRSGFRAKSASRMRLRAALRFSAVVVRLATVEEKRFCTAPRSARMLVTWDKAPSSTAIARVRTLHRRDVDRVETRQRRSRSTQSTEGEVGTAQREVRGGAQRDRAAGRDARAVGGIRARRFGTLHQRADCRRRRHPFRCSRRACRWHRACCSSAYTVSVAAVASTEVVPSTNCAWTARADRRRNLRRRIAVSHRDGDVAARSRPRRS